jgi:hypothetical protein
MSLDETKARILHAARTLQLQWADTRGDWNDEKSRDFEQDYLERFELQVAAALSAVNRLAEVLDRAYTECRKD